MSRYGMRETTEKKWVRQGRVKRIRLAVDIAMAFVYLLQMAPYQTGGWYHEVAGIAFVALLVAHHALNARWLRAELQRRDLVPLLLDAALLACVAGVAVTGMLMAQHVRLVQMPGVAHLVRPLHACLTYAGLMLVSVHAGMRVSVPPVEKLSPLAKGLLVVALLAAGIYTFVSLDVVTKLTMGMAFPDGMTPLPVLVGKHALLAGPFVLLGKGIAQSRRRGIRK